ncbi:MAG: DeoR/GlpR family DNA-binding transcription regulator [Oscillospiraceae bacterium]|nr:DeoR/GlpR family DNA-binding transcription regulator [Oscillospiraceae bacterium]
MKLDREQELMTRLSLVQKLSLSEAMDLLHVSESTARRMFAKLESDGFAIRTHGGVQCVSHAMTLYSFEYGARTNIHQKTAIAREACKLLEDGDVLFCDSGTTIQCFCAEMVYFLKREKLNIKVYTNSLANLELLTPYMPVTLVGGEYRENRKDFYGYLTEQALSGLYFNKSFVGADGCMQGKQFTTTDFETARVNEVAMRNSERTIMLVDSSKFKISSHVAYAPVQKLHAIVTDSGIDPATLAQLRRTEARVFCADVPEAEMPEERAPDERVPDENEIRTRGY